MQKTVLLSNTNFFPKYTFMGNFKFTPMMKMLCLAVAVITCSTMTLNSVAQTSRKLSDKQVNEIVRSNSNSIAFIENKGQWPTHVLYRADMPEGQMLATPEGMLIGKYDAASLNVAAAYETKVEEIGRGLHPGMSIHDLGPKPAIKGHGWKLNFLGGNKATVGNIERKGESADYYNYLIGDASSHATNVHSYNEITYKDVYTGVDVKYYTSLEGALENDIIVKPGSDGNQIKIQIDGIEELRLNKDGEIVLPTTVGEITIPSPVSYIIKDGRRSKIDIKYHLVGKNILSFVIPAYDKNAMLVVDPIVMRWGIMVGSNAGSDSHCHGIDVDASGNIYVTGKYQSGLITVGAFQSTSNGDYDLFIGKYQEPATPGNSGARVWQTYLGGSNTDNPYALNVGTDGYIYIAGITNSNFNKTYGSGFSAGGWTQRTTIGNGGQQVFIAKINSTGTGALVREIGSTSHNLSPYLYDLRILPTGGSNFDLIAVGYVTQQTGSSADGDVPAPVQPNGTAATSSSGNTNAYALRITSDLSNIKWSKQYASAGSTNQFNISVVDNSGKIYVGGITNGSSQISYNNPSGQTTIGGSQDGWIMSLDSSSGGANWSRYFNASSGNSVSLLCMEVNQQKTQFVIGGITSGLSSVNITSGAYSTTYNGGSHDFFVASLPVSGAATTWGTYFGGSGDETNMMGLNIDGNNDVYVLGYTASKNIPFPATNNNPIQTATFDATNSDAVFFKLTGSTGATLQYSTYMGGTSDDYDPIGQRGIRFNNCRIYLAITSNSTDFPLTQGTLNAKKNTATTRGEPILVSMANPPDLTGNSITGGGNQTITCGQIPSPITAGVPSYIIPNIIRDSVLQTNGTSAAYPNGIPTINSYQWQQSLDNGVTWTNIASATGQNYSPGAITTVGTIKFRRIINNDACNLAGDTLAVVSLVVTPTSPAPTVSSNSPACVGQTLQLNTTVSSGVTYSWSGPNSFSSSQQNPSITNVTAAAAGTYSLTVNQTSNGCPSYPGTVTVAVNNPPSAPTASSNSPVCSGGSIVLHSTGQSGATFNWTGPNSFTSKSADTTITNVTSANQGTYFVTQTVGGCASSAASVAVTVTQISAPTGVSASPNPACAGTGNSLTLSASGQSGATFTWTYPDGGGTTGSPVTRSNITTGMSGNYIVTQTVGSCISAKDTINVVINATPSAPSITALPNPVCTGDTLTLTATGQSGATFTWSYPDGGGATGNLINRFNVTTAMAGNYTATQTVTGCQSAASNAVNVVIRTTPVISGAVGSNPTTCGGTSGTITLSGLTSGQTYAVTYTKNGSSQGPTNFVASGGQVVITGLGAGTYTNIVVTLAGCASSPFGGTITLSDPAAPLAPSVSSNSPVCQNGTLTLGATGQSGAAYSWTGPLSYTSNQQNPTVSASATTGMAGSYCATQTVAGCTGPTGCVTVVVNSLPVISSTSSSSPTTCSGSNGTITLNGLTNGTTYSVTYTRNGVSQGPANLTANGSGQIIITGLNAGAYTTIVAALSGCSSNPTVGTITLTDPSSPSAPVVGSNTPVCQGDSIKLTSTGQGGATFAWTGPSGYNSAQQNPVRVNATTAMGGSYCAIQTVANCASPQACTSVTVNPLPVIGSVTSSNPTTCSGTDGTITINGLNANQQYSISYSKNNVSQGPVTITANGSGSVVITNLGAGNYTTIVVALSGCPSAPQGGTITLSNPSSPGAPTVSNTVGSVCQNSSLSLSASGQSGATYSWTGPLSYTSNQQNPVVSNSATLPMGGSYCATQTVANCTSPQACTIVTVSSQPTISGTSSSNPGTCGGTNGSITLSGLTAGQTYAVSYSKNTVPQGTTNIVANGSGQVIISGLTIGNYSNIIVTLNGCNSATAGPVTLSNPAGPNHPTASTNAPVCAGSTLTVSTVATSGATYQWTGPLAFNSGIQSPTVSASAIQAMSGTYKIIVTLNGCQDSSTVNVTVNQNPVANAGNGGAYCFGSGGSVNLGGSPTASGGSTPYSYAWSPNTSLSDSTNPNPVASPTSTKTYTVTVTDANSCKGTSTATVTVNPKPVANAGSGFIICNGTAVTIGSSPTASGGTSPYSYSWNNGASPVANPSVSPSSTTTYTVTVTDTKTCSASASGAVTVHSNPTADAGTDKSLPGCSVTGVTIGATPVASGGLAPYHYSWTPSAGLSSSTASNPTVSGIGSSTTYTVVVTDSNGCSASDAVLVTVTSSSLAVNIVPSGGQSWCANSNGSVTLNASPTGGTPSYTYAWTGSNLSSNSIASPIANPNTANTYVYSVLVTDSTGCKAGNSITITVNPQPTAQANASGGFTICNGGSITIGGSPTASGGTGSYSYSWSSGASPVANPVVSPISTTSYTVTVTDSKSCTATSSTSVTVYTKPSANAGADATLPTCSPTGSQIGGSPTGSGGGGAPFTYSWSPSVALSSTSSANPTVVGLAADTTYTVIVTDVNGCTASDQVRISVNGNAPTVSISNTGLTEWCAGTNTSINLTATLLGGTASRYSWSGNNISPTNAQIATVNPNLAGSYTYTVTVTDNFNCTASGSKTIKVDSIPTANAGAGGFTICNNATVVIGGSPTASGGNTPYGYSWTGGAGTIANPSVSPSITTTYTVTVTDSKNCTATSSATVTVHGNPTANAGADVNLPACSPTGIQIGGSPTASNGAPSYTYSWSPSLDLSSTSVSNPTVVGLNSDTTYTVIVTDVNHCSASDQVHVHITNSPPSVAITAVGNTEWCSGTGSSVSLTAGISGGSSPFAYNWSGTNISPTNVSTASANPNLPGSYTYRVTVTDAFNCTATATKTVIVDSVPVASAGSSNTICGGFNDTLGGSPTAKGGNAPYTYLWSGGAAPVANPIVSPVSTTTYIVTVTDNKGCTATASATITVRTTPVAQAGPDKILPTCSPTGIQIGGSPTASSGGGAPYTYSWSPATGLSSTTIANPTVVGLAADTTYKVVVTDVNGCTASDQVLVQVSHNTPSVTISSSGGSQWCTGSNINVNLTANVSNGSTPFSYSWSGTNISPTNAQVAAINPSAPGSYPYSVTITDAFNCTATGRDTITIDSLPHANAGGGNNTLFTICGGSSVVIGGSPTASGGVAPYTYAWSGGAASVANPTVNPVSTTTYTVTVTDHNGCSVTASTTVVVRTNPIASAGVDKTLPGCSPVGIQIGGSPTASGGGGGPYSYHWSPSIGLSSDTVSNPTVHGLATDTLYTVTITDANGCTASSSVHIHVTNAAPIVSISPSGATEWCAGAGSSVNLAANVSGGSIPYTYSWSGTSIAPLNASVATVNPNTKGNYIYTVTITDGSNCTASATRTINVDSVPTANAGAGGFTICNGSSVAIGGSPTASGGTTPYHYTWSGGAAATSNPTVNPSGTTTYILTVTDNHGCSATSSATVTVHSTPSANAGSDQNITSCAGDSVTIGGSPSATGGTASYTYRWSPKIGFNDSTITNPIVKNLNSTQTYTLVVTDANGCTSADNVVVKVVPSTLQANIAGTISQVCGGAGSCVQLGGLPTTSGGSAPYVYAWSSSGSLDNPTSSNPLACPLSTTTYNLTITDSKSCSVTASQTVTVNSSPVANAGPNVSVCIGSSVNIGGNPSASGGTSPYSYSWSPTSGLSLPNVSNPAASPNVLTAYQLLVTDNKGCSATASVIVTPKSSPIVNAGPDQTMTSCVGDTTVLGGQPVVTNGGTAPFTYRWTPGNTLSDSTIANPYVTGLGSSASYEIIVTDSLGCQGTDFISINVITSTLQANAGNDQHICGNTAAPVQLGSSPSAAGGSSPYTYHWSPTTGLSDSTVSNPTALPLTTTIYRLTVTDTKGCTSFDSVKVTVSPVPVSNAGKDTAICSGFGVVLGGSPVASGGTPGYQYSWTPTVGLNTNNVAKPVAFPQATTTYVVTVTDTNGCQSSSAIAITVRANPTANAGPDLTLTACLADSVRLGGSPVASGGTPGYTYAWSPSPNLSCNACANPTVTGLVSSTIYTLTVKDANGCSAVDGALVNVIQGNLSANAGAGGSYCSGSGSSVALGGAPTAAGGTASYTYRWTPSAGLSDSTNSNPSASPIVTTTYHLTITDAKGCSATDSAKVVVHSLPVAHAGLDTAICAGATVALGSKPTASGGAGSYTYTWAPGVGLSGVNSSNPFGTPPVTTTYAVTVTDGAGCTATSQIIITVRPNPVANAGQGVSLISCSSDSVQIGGTPSASGSTAPYLYNWTPNAGLSCNNCADPYVSHLGSSGTYTLVVTDSFGCSASSQVAVTVTGSTLTAYAGSSTAVCQGDFSTVKLGGSPTAVGGTPIYHYAWSPAAGLSDTTNPNPLATPFVTTVYNVVVTDAKGCVAQDTVKVTVNPRPFVDAGGPDTICSGTPIVLGGTPTATHGTAPYTYEWSPGTYFTSAGNIANPTAAPTSNIFYTLVVTDSNGCTNTGIANVKVYANPIANAGGDVSVISCVNACVNIGGSPTGSSGAGPYLYAWSPKTGINNSGLSNPTVCNLSSSTTYTITVTDINGCTATDQVFVSVTPSTLTADAGTDKSICSGQTSGVVIGANVAVSGGSLPYSINWSPTVGILNSSTIANPTAKPNDTTEYTLFVQDANGCTAIDSMIVFVTPPVTASVGSDTAICSGSGTVIGGIPTGSGGTPQLSYTWSPGTGLSSVTNPNPVASPAVNTTYCVTVTDAVNCSASACQLVNVTPGIHADAGQDKTMTYCSGSFVTLGGSPVVTGGSGSYTYSWSPKIVGGVQVLNGTNVPNPIVTGLVTTTTFTLSITDNFTGCTSVDQVVVNVNQSSLRADAGGGQIYCGGSGLCLAIGGNPTGTGGQGPYTYQWTGANISDPSIHNPCVIPAATTTYYVTVTDQLGCSAIDSAVIFVSPKIGVNAGADTTICYGTSVVLGGNPDAVGGTGGYTYQWSPSQFLTSISTQHPTAQTVTSNIIYTLTVTDSLHCSASGSITVALRPLPTANAGPPATIYACAGDSAILGGTPTGSGTVGPYTYSWTPPLNSSLSCLTCSNPSVQNLGFETQFCVQVTDVFGCQNSSCVDVTVLPNTVFVDAGNNLPTLCSNQLGSCVTLGAQPPAYGGNPPYTYHWIGGVSDSTGRNPQACPAVSSTYELIVTDIHGCQASDSVRVFVNNPPAVGISGLNPKYCVSAGNIFMTGTPAHGTFSGAGVTGNIFQPSVVGVGNWCITYTYTDPATGCSNDTTYCVNVVDLPSLSVDGFSPAYCQYDAPAALTGTPAGGTFSGHGMTGNVFNPATASIGNNVITYHYTDTASGCSNSTTVTIVVKSNPTLSLSLESDTVCNGSNTTITPDYSFDVFNIIWSKLGGGNLGSGLSPFVVHPTGVNYCVVGKAINTPNQCTANDTICMYVQQPPFVAPDTSYTCQQQPVVINVLAGVTDPQGHSDNASIVTGPAHGTLVLNNGTTYTYTPTNYYYGIDSFKFSTCNTTCTGTCDTGEVYVSVCYTHFPPVILDTTITMYENDSVHVCPFIYDVNGVPLVIGNAACSTLTGELTFTSDSCFEYIPNTNWYGNQILCITVCDTGGLCDTGTVTIHVLPVNRPPIALRETVYTCISTPIGINVSDATSDPEGNPLTYTYGQVNGPGNGNWHITGNGALVFVADSAGTYSFGYTVCNHSNLPPPSLCASNVIEVVVINCRTTPSDSIAANDDGVVTNTNTVTLVNELANDYYPDADSLTVTIIHGPGLSGATDTINANGTITYKSPSAGIDTLEYVICDPAPLCDTAFVIIFVDTMPQNIIYPPVAVDDFDSTNYETTIIVPVLSNDNSPNGDSMIVVALTCHPDRGTATINLNGTVTYTPDSTANAYHSDTFCYKICDYGYPNLCDTAVVVIYIRPSVFAVNDTVVTGEHNPMNIPVVKNDYTPDGDSIWVYQVITTGTVGTVTINSNGTVHYKPRADSCGFIDTFQYVDITSLGAKDTATVYVTVLCCGVPIAISGSYTIGLNDSLIVFPFVEDSVNPVNLAGEILSMPLHGTASFATDSTIVYKPDFNFCGYDTIVYRGKSSCGIDTGVISIHVKCRPVPYLVNDTGYICRKEVIHIPILQNDTVEPGLTLTLTNIGAPVPNNLGSVTGINNGVVTFTANNDSGTVRFTYTVCDNGTPQLCDTGLVVIFIQACPIPVLDTIYDTTTINTPDTVCIGAYVHGTDSWYISDLCSAHYGSAEISGTQCLIYVPNTGYFGNDTFCVIVCDSAGCDTSVAIITVLDTLIKAVPESCDVDSTVMNVAITVDELANDIIPKASDTTVVVQTVPVNGIAVVNADRTITYTPDSNYVGTEEFSYQVCAITGSYKYCDTSSICITIVDTTHHCFIPNAFSPNGDGTNDAYVIPCNDEYPKADLRVFDRWGMEVWTSDGHYLNDWGGRNQQGVKLPDGTYYIIYRYNNGSGKSEAKFVVISR